MSQFPQDNFTLIITDNCNLDCSYCFEKNKNQNHDMNISMAKECIDYIFNTFLPQSRYLNILLLGGEPLLKIDLIEQIILYTISKNSKMKKWENIMFDFSTNGTLLHITKIREFIKKYQDYLCISLSLDGNKITHDLNRSNSFDIVIDNIKYLKNILDKFLIITTISQVSVDCFLDSIRFSLSLNIKDIETNIVYEAQWDDKSKQKLKEQLLLIADYIINNKIYEHVNIPLFAHYFLLDVPLIHCNCSDGQYHYTFDYKGNIYPCLRFAFIDNPLIIGNILNKKIDYKKLLPLLLTNKKIPKKCNECKYHKICNICLAIIYNKTKSIFNIDDKMCEIIKIIYETNEYYWNKLLYTINVSKKYFITKIQNGKPFL